MQKLLNSFVALIIFDSSSIFESPKTSIFASSAKVYMSKFTYLWDSAMRVTKSVGDKHEPCVYPLGEVTKILLQQLLNNTRPLDWDKNVLKNGKILLETKNTNFCKINSVSLEPNALDRSV